MSKSGKITLSDFLGVLVVLGIAIGILVPILASSIMRTYKQEAFTDFDRLMQGIAHIPFMKITKKLVKEYTLNVNKEFHAVIEVTGGAIKITEGHGNIVKIRVYAYEGMPWFKGVDSERKYNVYYCERTNTLSINVNRYSVVIEIPSNYISSISLSISGGVAKIDTPLTNLKYLVVNVSGGAVDLKPASLGKVNVSISISITGGALDGNLEFSRYVGESDVKIDMSGGAIDLDIQLPSNVKVKVNGEFTSGIVSVKINGEHVGRSYIEDGYEQASSKIYISYDVHGGIIDVGIRK